MHRFTSWARCFVLVFLYCVDYNLAQNLDEEIQRLTDLVKGWREKERYVCSKVRLKEIPSETRSISIRVVEKIKPGWRNNENHFWFDITFGGTRLRSFYDFQIDAFVFYFENYLKFVLREGGEAETMSLDFVSEEDARYFYSKAATFGNVHLGKRFDKIYNPSEIVVESYDRLTTERKSTSENYENGIIIHSRIFMNTIIFNLSTFERDEAYSKVPILIFSSGQFNVGPRAMGKKVMLYLIDHDDTIFVVNFPSLVAANRFYTGIMGVRFISKNGMISLDEMKKYEDYSPQ